MDHQTALWRSSQAQDILAARTWTLQPVTEHNKTRAHGVCLRCVLGWALSEPGFIILKKRDQLPHWSSCKGALIWLSLWLPRIAESTRCAPKFASSSAHPSPQTCTIEPSSCVLSESWCSVQNQNQNQKKLYCQVRFYTYEEFVVVMLVHASNNYQVKI